jgi:hypothetical protein
MVKFGNIEKELVRPSTLRQAIGGLPPPAPTATLTPLAQQQVRSVARLVGDLAAITSMLAILLCDLLFASISG